MAGAVVGFILLFLAIYIWACILEDDFGARHK